MFRSALEKLKRANEHIAEFERRCTVFTDSNPYRASIKANPEHRNYYSISFTQRGVIPDLGVSAVLGDAVHNLCCVLDHMVWEIVGIDTGNKQQDRLQFPRSNGTRSDFEATVGGINGKETPRADTKDFLNRLEVYKGGKGEFLLCLLNLDVRDKHLRLTPMCGIARASCWGFQVRGVGHTLEVDCGPLSEGRRSYGFQAMAGSLTISAFTDSPLDLNQEPQIAAFVGFEDIEPFPNEPILPHLVRMSREVRIVLESAVEFMRTRAT